MLLMLDNYDSFTFNLVQYLEELGASVTVVRNDQTSVQQVCEQKPACLCLLYTSPSPRDS